MILKVKEIPRAGKKIDAVLKPEEIGVIENDLKVVSPVKVHGEVRRAQDAVIADVEVAAKYEFVCSRCLEPIVMERKDDFEVYFDIQPTTDTVDLGEEIRQEMLVTVSPIVLCKPDCKGLCPKCGENLNLNKCKCKK